MQCTGKFFAALGVCFFISPTQVFASPDWILLASTDSVDWEGQAGSMHLAKNNSGQDVSVVSGRVRDKRSKRIEFERWYVLVSACRYKSGKLITTDMGGIYKNETDFVLNGGSVASSLADMLCSVVLDADGKGIAI